MFFDMYLPAKIRKKSHFLIVFKLLNTKLIGLVIKILSAILKAKANGWVLIHKERGGQYKGLGRWIE